MNDGFQILEMNEIAKQVEKDKTVSYLVDLVGFMIVKHSPKTAQFYIETLENLYKDALDSEIDNFIEISIKSELPELTVFLLDYKMKNNLYKESDWSL
jgi:hypothetical protein